MTLRTANRVRDTTTTTGTGTLTVTGSAPVGYIPFTSIPSIATNDTYLILIAHQTLNEWEICLGTHASSTTISRGTPEASSNAGASVNFSAGTKDVVLVQTAGRTVVNTSIDFATGGAINFGGTNVTVTHASGQLTFGGSITNVTLGGTGSSSFVLGLAAAGTVGIEIGRVDGTTGTAFMDWHSSATVVDYDARILIDTNTGTVGGGDLQLVAACWRPQGNDGSALGKSGTGWSDLYLASGGVINWAAANMTMTHATGSLTVAGGNFIAPTIAGGSGAASALVIESTTGAGTSDMIVFKTGSQVETLRLDTAGRMIEAPGGSASLTIFGNQDAWQVYGNTLATAGFAMGSFSTTDGAHIDFYRSRSATIGQATVLQAGDDIGSLNFYGAQQTGTFSNQTAAAKIRVYADGTITSGAGGDMPTSMSFQTTRDGSGTLKQHLKFTPDGACIWGDDDEYTGARIQIQDTTGDDGSTFGIWRWTNDNAGPRLRFSKSRGTSRGSNTVIQVNDQLFMLWVQGSDGTNNIDAAFIRVEVDGTPGTNDMPTRMIFQVCPDGSATPATTLQLSQGGIVYMPRLGTTVTAGNCFIDNGTTPANALIRSTSSIRYKSNVTAVPQDRIDRVMALRPIEFNSLSEADDPYARFVGLSAEEVNEIDPQLCNFDAEGRPDGVQYERVLLLQVAALQQRLAILEAKGLQ